MTGPAIRWRRRYGVFLLALIAALSGWWLREEAGRAQRPSTDETAMRADYTLRDFSMTRYDDGGRALRAIEGAEMVHFDDAGLATIKRLRLDDRRRHWRAEALEAVLVEERRFIRLQGDVRLTDRPSASLPLRLFSDDLDIDLDAGRAETDGPVRIEQGRIVTEARGLRLSMERRHLRLLADVHSRYEPDGR